MAKCWEKRGCDAEMMADCAHNNPEEQCPAACAFAKCERPTAKPTSDAGLVFDPTVDRSAAMRVDCTFCEFFLKHGPRVA